MYGPCADEWTKIFQMYTAKATDEEMNSICGGHCLRTIMLGYKRLVDSCVDEELDNAFKIMLALNKFVCTKNEHNKYCMSTLSTDDMPTDSTCTSWNRWTDLGGCCISEMTSIVTAVLDQDMADQYKDALRAQFNMCGRDMPNGCNIPQAKAAHMNAKITFSFDSSATVNTTVVADAACDDFRAKTKLQGDDQVQCSLISDLNANSQNVASDSVVARYHFTLAIVAYGDASGVTGLKEVKAALDNTDWSTAEWTSASAAAGTTIVADSVATEAPVAGGAGRMMVGIVTVLAILAMLL